MYCDCCHPYGEIYAFSLTDIPFQIVFDECHKAKNASSTKMGKAVLDLQNKLPRARVVYASATGKLLSQHGVGTGCKLVPVTCVL